MISFAETLSMLRYSARCKAVRHGMFAVLAAALLALVIMLAWWGPAQREHAQLLHSIDARRAAMVEGVRSAQVARAQREALPVVALLEKKLQAHSGQAELIQGIARLAARRGVRVVSQSFDEGKAQRGDAAIYLELGLLGDYPSLRRLMGDLAALPMWIEVVEERLELVNASGGQVKAQMRLLTYRGTKGQQ